MSYWTLVLMRMRQTQYVDDSNLNQTQALIDRRMTQSVFPITLNLSWIWLTGLNRVLCCFGLWQEKSFVCLEEKFVNYYFNFDFAWNNKKNAWYLLRLLKTTWNQWILIFYIDFLSILSLLKHLVPKIGNDSCGQTQTRHNHGFRTWTKDPHNNLHRIKKESRNGQTNQAGKTDDHDCQPWD